MAFWRCLPWRVGIGLVSCIGQSIGWLDLLLACCGVAGFAAQVARLLLP
jgi:hypothetical protein